jgi:REP element-mobilizing transposase RayT/DNA-binding transcriptional ArsR family regulator
VDFPDALYHVTSRGNGRQEVFWTDDDRQRFLGQLADGVASAAIVLYAFAVMDNHFHLLARTPRANLSQFMQRLNSSYALYARFKHRRPGHQFQGRFQAKLVEDETYLRMLTRYIHLNPIKIATCRKLGRAARVRRLEAYAWSSYPGYVDARKRLDFVCYDLLADYGRTLPEARRQYRAYVHACVWEDDAPILAAMAASRHAIGGGEFVEHTERRLAIRRSGRAVDRDLDLPRATVPVERIDEAVAAHYGVMPTDLESCRVCGGAAKFVAVELACRLTGMTQRAIGAHYGAISSAGVSNIRRRLREGQYALSDVVLLLYQQITTVSS